MSNYPDDNRCNPIQDAEKCANCGRREYTNDSGVCDECEWRQKKTYGEHFINALNQVTKGIL